MLRPFYFCYFTGVAISLPFFPPYLRSLGLSGKQVSSLLVIAPFLHLGVPLVWGWLADRTRRPDLLLRIACFGAFVFYSPMIIVRTMPAMLLVFFAHQIFSVPITGLADTLAMERVRQGEDYGRIRVWGSLSFLMTCLGAAPIIAARGRADGDPLVPTLATIALGLTFVAAMRVRGQGGQPRPHAKDVKILLADKRFLFLLTIAPLHWACTAPFHGFFAILLQDRKLPPTVAGHAFMVAVFAEMLALFFLQDLRQRFSLRALLIMSFSASVVRWIGIAVSDSALVLTALQILHGLTFGMFWGAALLWIGECVPPSLRATGQTLYTAATFGIGNIVGMLGSGFLYDAGHGAALAFWAAAVLQLVPLGLLIFASDRLVPIPVTRPRVVVTPSDV